MIVAVGIVKDEADIIGYTIDHLHREGVDHIVVADNMSTDGTVGILAQSAVQIVYDRDPAWYQARKMNDLIAEHCKPGDWVIPFDADERWTGITGTLRDALSATQADVLNAQVYDYLPTPHDPDEPNPFTRICWREPNPETYPVVAFRYTPGVVIEEGNHGVRHPGRVEAGLSVRHYQYRSFEQFCRKLRNGRRALEATNLPAYIGAHWRTWGALDDEALREQWDALTGQALVFDPL